MFIAGCQTAPDWQIAGPDLKSEEFSTVAGLLCHEVTSGIPQVSVAHNPVASNLDESILEIVPIFTARASCISETRYLRVRRV
jgi:hypothetical protein